MVRLLNNVWFLWFLLTIPFFWILFDRYVNHVPPGRLFYWSGVFGIWFMLAALAVTPLQRLFRGAKWTRWLVQHRRYLGVAAFAYSLLHTVYWMQQASPKGILKSFLEPLVLYGWIGMFIFLAMAATSNDWSVRTMGPNWKRLQRWVYLAAPLALLHWFMASRFRLLDVVLYGGLLIAIVVARLYVRRRRAQA